MEYKEIIVLPKEKYDRIIKATNDATLDEGESIISTAKFSNGFQMDVKCNGCAEGQDPYLEAVLFDEKGHERGWVDGVDSDEYLGEWSIEYKGDTYTVDVKAPQTNRIDKQESYNVTVPWTKINKWLDSHKRAGIVQTNDGLKVIVNANKIFRNSYYTLARFKCINPDMHKEPEKMVYILVAAYVVTQSITLVGNKYRKVLVGPKAQRKDIFEVMAETYKFFR